MPREKVGITLTKETLKSLERICKHNGLAKSQAISLAINTYVNEKLGREEASREDK
jgi:metal-responsive CopG/Arc/MetJ family transcriptional regulator